MYGTKRYKTYGIGIEVIRSRNLDSFKELRMSFQRNWCLHQRHTVPVHIYVGVWCNRCDTEEERLSRVYGLLKELLGVLRDEIRSVFAMMLDWWVLILLIDRVQVGIRSGI